MRKPMAGGAAVLLLASGVLAGCSEQKEPVAGATPEVKGPARVGPAPSWSLPLVGGVAEIGDVLVVDSTKTLRGLDRSTGRELWKLDHGSLVRMRVASGLLVAWIAQRIGSGDGRIEVLDPATGKPKWRADPVREEYLAVHQDAVYVRACQDRETVTGCTITSRDVRTGQQRWQIPSQSYGVSDASIGVHSPNAPAAGRYLAARVAARDRTRAWTALDRLTGKATAARATDTGWPVLAVGNDLIVTNYASRTVDDNCAIELSAIGAVDGKPKPVRIGYLDRAATPDDCPRINPSGSPQSVLNGAGSRIVVGTKDRSPQLIDLATGRSGWRAEVRGVALDTDGRSVLVRERTAEGKLTVLDFGTGRVRWTAPDPGPNPERGAGRYAFVTERLVLVAGSTGDWNDGTAEDQAACVVYDVRTGRRLAVLPGRPAGAGKDWVAVHTPSGQLELTRF